MNQILFNLNYFVIREINRFKFSQVVRKSRSKIQYSSDGHKISSDKSSTVTSESVSREASCLSSNSSARSKSSHYGGTTTSKRQGPGPEEMMKKRKRVGSNHIRRRADAILKFLSAGCFSEVKIRQALGDSPDTSKALRMWYLWSLFLLICTFSSLLVCLPSCDVSAQTL